jgi:hypothetical protein
MTCSLAASTCSAEEGAQLLEEMARRAPSTAPSTESTLQPLIDVCQSQPLFVQVAVGVVLAVIAIGLLRLAIGLLVVFGLLLWPFVLLGLLAWGANIVHPGLGVPVGIALAIVCIVAVIDEWRGEA